MKRHRCPTGSSLHDRLAAYTMPVTESGCWIWIGSLNKGGYGQINVDHTMINAHRASWVVHRGSIPDGMSVLHACDVRCCVNPDHLFLGSHNDNMRDMKGKGRSAWGARSGQSRLTPSDIAAIRASDRNQYELAEEYGVQQPAISAIQRGERWRGLSDGVRVSRKRRTKRGTA